MEYVIETQNLVKKYKTKLAVDDVSLHINKGEIYGLVGKNGAGKTTLMKLIIGLATPTDGKVFLFGKENDKSLCSKIGSLIESPALIRNCTARENLLRFSIVCGADVNEIDSLLSLVGLSDVGKKKVSQFSLGMKQRLGLAIALLSHPEVLILDEPLNGLDPEGMKEIRDIILDLNSKGVTFIISSHLLEELTKVATRYGILSEGKLVQEITAEELKGLSSQRGKIVCDDAQKAVELLRKNFEGIKTEIIDGEIMLFSHLDETAEINAFLVGSGIKVRQIKLSKKCYENYFLEKLK